MQKKVLMVCLGNICRSPLAEGILKSKLSGTDHFVDSAGTAGYHIGNPPDPRSVKTARYHGIDISIQRCRKFQVSDFDDFDYIYVMDKSNYADILSLARDQQDVEKVDLILNLVYPGSNLEVPDPYYGGDQGFENVFNMLDEACNILIQDKL